tara:strand:+ start:316 stop:744 length:429 start_codon:yes stop_codon:yes gene_type:complete
LAAAIAGFLSLGGYAKEGTWALVEHASAQQAKTLDKKHHEKHDVEPHENAATQEDIASIRKDIHEAVKAMQAAAEDARRAARMAGSMMCRDVGGRPHPETRTCVFLVNGDVEIVSLDNEESLRARSKLSRAETRALNRRREP